MKRKRKQRGDSGERSSRLVPMSRVIPAVMIAALLAGAAVAVVDRLALDAPAGPRGPEGPPGPAGEAGELDPALVWEQIEADPERLSELLDPTPSELGDRDEEHTSEIEDVSRTADQVRDDLGVLCSDLSLTDALSNEILSCP